NYVFPTLGQVVVIEAILLRPGEWDTIRQAAAEELAPLIGLDSRHHVWSGVTTRGRRPTGENQLTD
ncbi:MAG: hypothetical protein KGY99_08665, partial [Phycisphaerae bacterium]|nr:hypothetical protein [Phycisphaerae bacterium]